MTTAAERKQSRSSEENGELIAQMRAANPAITTAELAEALELTPRRIRQIEQETATAEPKRTRTAADTPPGAGKRSKAHAELAAQLCQPIAKLAMGFAFTMPTCAAVLMARGEATADALVSIAAEHPRMLRALQSASQLGAVADLFETGVQLVIAASLDTGRMPPEHPIAALTGVASLYAQVHPPAAPESNGATVHGFPVGHAPFPAPGMPQP